jgi:hypothetical protein
MPDIKVFADLKNAKGLFFLSSNNFSAQTAHEKKFGPIMSNF